MVNKVLILVFTMFVLLGCRSKKTLYDKEITGAEVEKIVQVEKKVEEVKKKDSVVEKKVDKKDEKVDTNLHVEFDPKKGDSIEVIHTLGGDSLKLKVNGNGVVIFDYKSTKNNTSVIDKTIFGSETLYKVDSVVSTKDKSTSKTEKIKKSKEVTVKGTTTPMYIIFGIGAIVAMVLLWLLFKLKK